MSEYEHTDNDGDRVRAGLCDRPSDLGWIQVDRSDGKIATVYVPADHALRIVAALTGRKVAVVIYEDELPSVRSSHNEAILSAGGSNADADDAQQAREWALGYFAIARHIEARDAANDEAEREARLEEIKAYDAWHSFFEADGEDGVTPHYSRMVERLVKAGARAPQAAPTHGGES